MNLADAAAKLGDNTVVMNSYWLFQTKARNWFFSPNPHLKSATHKPRKFSTWKDWYSFSDNQKRTVACLAGFKEDATDVIKGDTHLLRLRQGYSQWQENLYSVFWANNYSGTWTCNIFVGDVIYLAKGRSVVAGNNHYYTPSQIKIGVGPFIPRKSFKDAQVGDIVVMLDGEHVEIVTKFTDSFFLGKGFCSRGGGRGSRDEMGKEKCEEFLNNYRDSDNSSNKFYHL
jgi:hypothetical protein